MFSKYLFVIVFLFFSHLNICISQNGRADSTNNSPQLFIIDSIIIKGNKVTKDHIIIREFMFTPGDTIARESLEKQIEKTHNNLMNTSLFNFVFLDTIQKPGSHILVEIKLIERWYTWPFPILEISDRNFNVWWEEKDLNRISYGFFLVRENFRGRKETLKLLMRLGYDQTYGFAYNIPYINEKQTLGVGFASGVSMNKEVAYQTKNNDLVFFKDSENTLRTRYYSVFQLTYRKQIYNTHIFNLGYEQNLISDTLLKLNPDYSSSGEKLNRFFNLSYFFQNDHRDYKAYPLEGHYFDVGFFKYGLGVYQTKTVNHFHIKTNFRKYYNIYNRWNYAFGITGKYSFDANQPYYLTQGLGFGRELVRAYELYVVDGEHFFLFKNNLKFNLIKPRILKINSIPTEKFNTLNYAFYLNLFFDAGYVSSKNPTASNDLTNTWLTGQGIGLDFVTYYDRIMRLEFSMNRMKETGIFLHFIAPI